MLLLALFSVHFLVSNSVFLVFILTFGLFNNQQNHLKKGKARQGAVSVNRSYWHEVITTDFMWHNMLWKWPVGCPRLLSPPALVGGRSCQKKEKCRQQLLLQRIPLWHCLCFPALCNTVEVPGFQQLLCDSRSSPPFSGSPKGFHSRTWHFSLPCLRSSCDRSLLADRLVPLTSNQQLYLCSHWRLLKN